MKAWKRVEPTTVTKVGWRKITSKTFVMSSGETTVFDTLHSDGQEFAGVLGLTNDNKVIIARQFRPGPELVMEELPGGFVDAGETPEQSARREFLEETGYEVGSMRYLGKFYKDTYMNATWHAFLALDCVLRAPQKLEAEEEDIEIATISIEQLLKNAKTGKMTDAVAVLLAYDTLKEIQETEATTE
jgi:ADP-ribose pyrophosphatase